MIYTYLSYHLKVFNDKKYCTVLYKILIIFSFYLTLSMFDLSKHEMIKNCTKPHLRSSKLYKKVSWTWTVVIGKNEQFSIFAKHPLFSKKFIGCIISDKICGPFL